MRDSDLGEDRQVIKITTWNVNGLRAAAGKGILDWLSVEAPDALCLQEVRARREQLKPEHLSSLEEMYSHITWNPGERPGYSGVATFSGAEPVEVALGMAAPEFDGEGRVICSRYPGFLLFNIYFPNGGRTNERVPYKLDFYAHLLKLCDCLMSKGEELIITGDFNTAHREIDLRNPRQNVKNTGFLPEERQWIDRYLEHGFIDIYRRLYPERVQYTWWAQYSNARSRGVGWRLDYFLITPGLLERVKDVIIHEDVPGSDHCPVSLLLE